MATSAKESKKVRKVRKKLEQLLEEEHRAFTPERLAKVSENIHKWINRHDNERIDIKSKTFRLFDQNLHSAPTQSRYVNELMEQIKKDYSIEDSLQSLRGRITPRPGYGQVAE